MSRLPTLTAKEVSKALQKAGFQIDHQRGSHLVLWHPVSRKRTTVPMHPGDLRRNLMKEIIKQAGLSEDEFRALL
jgi:predicted RNA binding protein YcfA (HicA-like mRNA interferase family)